MWATAGLVILGGREVQADDVANQLARLAAPQRIRADAASTLKPAALSHDGRLIAFVARDRDSLERQCCLNVYVLDTSTGLITQESVSPEGTPSGATVRLPASARMDESSRSRLWRRISRPARQRAREAAHHRARTPGRSTTDAARAQVATCQIGLTSDPVVSGDGLVPSRSRPTRANLAKRERTRTEGKQMCICGAWKLDESARRQRGRAEVSNPRAAAVIPQRQQRRRPGGIRLGGPACPGGHEQCP